MFYHLLHLLFALSHPRIVSRSSPFPSLPFSSCCKQWEETESSHRSQVAIVEAKLQIVLGKEEETEARQTMFTTQLGNKGLPKPIPSTTTQPNPKLTLK